MADAIAVGLRFAHILFGVMWMGTILIMTLLFFPRVGKMEPSHQRNFFLTYTRPLYHYAEGAAILTIVFGVGLYGYLFSMGSLFSGTAHGSVFLLALVLSLVVWLLGFTVLFPRLKKATRIMEGMTQPGPPPAELMQLMKPLPMVGNVAVVLVLVVLALMIVGVTGAYT